MKTDVVIIGAGPAGLAAGGRIAGAGFDVLIFEKSEYPGKNKICGGAVSMECFLDLKLPKKIIEKQCSKIVVNFPDQNFTILVVIYRFKFLLIALAINKPRGTV